MRIGLFSDTFPPEINGVANSTDILRRQLEKHGHEVYVVSTYKGIGEAKWEGNVLRLAGMELKFLYGYVLTLPIHFHALEIIKGLNLDLIHAQTEFGVGIFAHICASQLKIPLVSTYHTTYEDYTHYVNFIHSKTVDTLAKKAIAKLSKLYGDTSMEVIAPSEKTKEMLIGYKVRKNIDVIPTGLDLDKFSPAHLDDHKSMEIRNTYGFQKEDVVVVYVGRLAKEKALDMVVDGFALAKDKARLLIVGGGPDFDNLQEKINTLHLQDTVKMSGPIPGQYIPDIYRACDAFISASLSETQGMTFIEALASGLPLFARKDEVLEDLLIENETGWYFEKAEDIPVILDRLLSLTEKEKEQMKAQCLKRVNPYSDEVFYEQVMKVYERVVDAYQNMYVVHDVSVMNNSVKIALKNANKDEQTIKASLDDYLEKKIRIGQKLTPIEVENLIGKEEEMALYQSCLRKLSARDRSKKEMKEWMISSKGCTAEKADDMVHKLEEKGYLDDERYAKDKALSLSASLYGCGRIEKILREKGIPSAMIETALSECRDKEEDNAIILASKIAHSKKYDSMKKMKNTIRTKLSKQGYDYELAGNIVDGMDFTDHLEAEKENLRKCAEKARKRYSRKYAGREMQMRIYQYCMMQGYRGEDIRTVIEEMGMEDED